jgi:hypothetical protein
MARIAASIEDKKSRLDNAQQGLEQLETLVEKGILPKDSPAVATAREELRVARAGYESGLGDEFRKQTDDFSRWALDILSEHVVEAVEEIKNSTDEQFQDGFFASRVKGRELQIRWDINRNSVAQFKLINPKESKPRTFRIINFSGPTSPDFDMDQIWPNKKTFIETLCSRKQQTIEKRGEQRQIIVYSYQGVTANTVAEMWKNLENNNSLEVEHLVVTEDEYDSEEEEEEDIVDEEEEE